MGITSPKENKERDIITADVKEIAGYLDELFKIPGTNISVGLDALLGFMPGAGDAASTFFSFYIIYKAAILGAPRRILFKMLTNITLDTFIGAIPFLGDIFDIFWKSNMKNVALLNSLSHAELKPRTQAEVVRSMGLIISVFFILCLAGMGLIIYYFWKVLSDLSAVLS